MFHCKLASHIAIAAIVGLASQVAFAQRPPVSAASKISFVSTTIPSNGDVNPYGIVRVPVTTGYLTQGNLLISNFNSSANLQGTGTTIVQISPSGQFSLFAQINASTLPGACPGGVGLTTALAVLNTGTVIVGSLPTTDGTSATAQAGCLIVLDSLGNVLSTISDSNVNGPWDMTAYDQTSAGRGGTATLFVTNVLNGTVAADGKIVNLGTVLRIVLSVPAYGAPSVMSETIVGSTFAERTDPAALVIGPTGLGLNVNRSNLYVADSLNNRIASIANPLTRTTSAGIGTTVSTGGSLNDPLGLVVAPNGNIVTVNGVDGRTVQTTPAGKQVSVTLLDRNGNPPGAGALFGLVSISGGLTYYVDDATNTLNLFQ